MAEDIQPVFTRRHYLVLAKLLRENRPTNYSMRPDRLPQWATASRDQWHRQVSSVATVLQIDNPNFNREQFLKASGAMWLIIKPVEITLD